MNTPQEALTAIARELRDTGELTDETKRLAMRVYASRIQGEEK